MSPAARAQAKGLAQAFARMRRPASQGGSGGTFSAAATKAGHADTPAGRAAFAKAVLNHPQDYSTKMVRKANFYKNIIAG